MRLKQLPSPKLALSLILAVAFAKHLLTFLAYDWYAGTDGYSYDISGLQLVSGRVFDIFPIIFRPPVTPILKNILYLLFEGHPYILAVLTHALGIVTVAVAYDLGRRFNNAVGFIVGMLLALNLPMAAHFHHIATFTFFLPLLLLSADCFVVWLQRPGLKLTLLLGGLVCLTFLTRLEALILVPVFAALGWANHRRFYPAITFLCVCAVVYNLSAFFYYTNFGYWGITYNKGWALFTRVSRARDCQFDMRNGPASRQVYGYMRGWLPGDLPAQELSRMPLLTFVPDEEKLGASFEKLGISDITLMERQMYTLNMAQKDIGYLRSDELFLRACLEGIRSDYPKFARGVFLRVLGQLDICSIPSLERKEYGHETGTGHMWGFDGEVMAENKVRFNEWRERLAGLESPLRWERQAIKMRLLRLFGLTRDDIAVPGYFRLEPSTALESGSLRRVNCGDGNMEERIWTSRSLEAYFFLSYWGQRSNSETALKILKYWDMFLMPGRALRVNIHRLMWIFWVIGIFLIREKWQRSALAAFLCVAVLYALFLSVFCDYFGGRLELHMRTFLLLGGSAGILSLIGRIFPDKPRKTRIKI